MVMKLNYLVKGMDILEQHGAGDLEIKGLANDSRNVKKGYLFVAVRGTSEDGHRYINHAVRNGACAVAVEVVEKLYDEVTVIRLPHTRNALAELSARFYNYPAKNMNLIGITGTNGKTTTSYILESILKKAGRRVGIIGSVAVRFDERSYPASLTTPESIDLMRIMAEMRDAEVTDVIAEVSSHSLDQGRTRGLMWSRALFTNLSREHLDYHSTMDAYFKAKSLLFSSLKEAHGYSVKAVINTDDPWGRELKSMTEVPVVSYGLEDSCLVKAVNISYSPGGSGFTLVTPKGRIPIVSHLMGRINVYNILAAAAVAISLDMNLDAVAKGIQGLTYVPGRLQPVRNRRGLSLFVDYAHTPDALEKVLQTLRPFTYERLITVFGCGGDRDRGKRPDMGRIAGRCSDVVIITSDNPRGEDPADIARDIEEGIKDELERVEPGRPLRERAYMIVLDRGEAIQAAVDMAQGQDIVLIAGKGHEDYQIIGETTRYFDDVEQAERAAS